MRPRPLLRSASALVLVALAGPPACGGNERDDARRSARRDARLEACIAEEIQRNAGIRLATLDELLEQHRAEGSVPAIVSAPHTFARVYSTVADLYTHELAYRDSALHASSREDSLRFVRMAESYSVPAPSPGSVEANVHRDYVRDFVGARSDPDHVCNRLVADGGDDRRRR
jgi:hypothetical protein